MMNKLLLAALVVGMVACQSKSKPSTESKAHSDRALKVEVLLEQADQLIEQEVIVQGHVTHTCKHSGKRCFIVGEDPALSLRIESGGDIQGFNRELVGNTINVKGVLKERRLTETYLEQWEEKVKAKEAKEDGSAETCSAEMNNIDNMREWMKANNKAYYSIYFLNGINYEVVD